MISVNDIAISFGANQVLRGVNFKLAAGELVGLVGPSGGGKSVLLKILGDVLKADRGSVVTSVEPGETQQAEGVGFLFQEGALFDSMSVLDNVAYPLIAADRRSADRCSRETAYARAFEILSEVGLAKAAAKFPGQLSGGMRRRVALARALVSRPGLVLLDDPTGGLDPVAATVIIELIKSLHQHYQPTVVIVSHDIRRLLPNVTRVLALFDGRIVCDQPPHALSSAAPEEVVHFLATRFDFSAFDAQEVR